MDHKIEFELNDAAGVAHTYTAHLHPADIGLELSFELISVLGEPLLKALGGVQDVVKTAVRAGGSEEDELESVLGSLDLAGAVGALRSLSGKAVADLTKRVLSHTYRDGARLKEGLTFAKAYQGNYGEMYLALWKVIEGNRFIPLLGTLSETE